MALQAQQHILQGKLTLCQEYDSLYLHHSSAQTHAVATSLGSLIFIFTSTYDSTTQTKHTKLLNTNYQCTDTELET